MRVFFASHFSGRIVCGTCSKARLPVPDDAPLEDQPPNFVEKHPATAIVRYCDVCSGAGARVERYLLDACVYF